MTNKYNLLTILGATATGKTTLAANLAYILDTEIISGDSRQVYRNMNIGTGKDYEDYIVNDKTIKYHLIDIKDPGYRYSVYEFQNDFISVFENISESGKIPILCGGTGLYIESVLKGYKLFEVPKNIELRENLLEKSNDELIEILSSMKELHNTTDTNNKENLLRAIEIETFNKSIAKDKFTFPKINSLTIGINFDRDSRRKRITERLNARLKSGMIEEIEEILKSGTTKEALIAYGLEYKYITYYILGQLSYEEMFAKLNTEIHRFAKRQMTWFRRMQRNGIKIHWIDGYTPLDKKILKVSELLYE